MNLNWTCNVVLNIKLLHFLLFKEVSSQVARQTPSCRTFLMSSYAMNTSTMLNKDDVFKEFLKTVPPLSYDYHKGQAGRVAVVGGCEEYGRNIKNVSSCNVSSDIEDLHINTAMIKQSVADATLSVYHQAEWRNIYFIGYYQQQRKEKRYTGAPYFAGITALKVGADLSHVICTKDAATAIKSYSPELIVHPLLDKDDGLVSIKEWLPRLHSVLVGPGLGRSQENLNVARSIMNAIKEKDTPLVIDADGMFIVSKYPDTIKDRKNTILTPNVVEFKRLISSLNLSVETQGIGVLSRDINEAVAVSRALGGVTIVRKGAVDIIANGDEVVIVDDEGSPRRCGGQGDLLSGAAMVFSYWAHRRNKESPLKVNPGLAAAHAACLLTRKCARAAFVKHHRSTTTTDLIDNIDHVFRDIFEP